MSDFQLADNAEHRARRVIAINGRIPLVNLTDAELSAWATWFGKMSEDMFSDPRQKSYFRLNSANLTAEIMWRKKELPF